jgi:outer membrane lipoprotein SlyB
LLNPGILPDHEKGKVMKMPKKMVFMFMVLTGSISSQAFAWNEYDIGRDSRQRNETLGTGRVMAGVVLQTRDIAVQSSTASQTVSTSVGALLGGAIGSKAGKGNGRYVATALGGVLGGLAGNQVGDMISSAKAQEIIVKREDGGLSVLTQAESDLREGDQVYLVESAGKVRVIRAYR